MQFDIIQINEPATGDTVVIAERLGGQYSENRRIADIGVKVILRRVSYGGIDSDGNPFSLWLAGLDDGTGVAGLYNSTKVDLSSPGAIAMARPWAEAFQWGLHYAMNA